MSDCNCPLGLGPDCPACGKPKGGPLTTYMFDLGDSNDGPVGAVIEVQAKSKPAAFKLAKQVAAATTDHPVILQTPAGEARFYLNPDNMRPSDGWREE